MGGKPDIGVVRHFETVGHVAGEADVQDGRLDAVVLYDVHHMAHQGSCLPSEGAAGFQDDFEPRVAVVQPL